MCVTKSGNFHRKSLAFDPIIAAGALTHGKGKFTLTMNPAEHTKPRLELKSESSHLLTLSVHNGQTYYSKRAKRLSLPTHDLKGLPLQPNIMQLQCATHKKVSSAILSSEVPAEYSHNMRDPTSNPTVNLLPNLTT